jgi:hypothetical protein
MKKILSILLIAVFLTVLLTPLASAALLGVDASGAPQLKNYISLSALFDNRQNSSRFFDDSEAFVSNAMPIKNRVLDFGSLIQSKLLKSTSANVVTGRDGYLFSTEELDSEMSEEEILAVADTVNQINDYCKSKGVKFVLAVAPNKSTALKSKLPYYAKSRCNSNYDRVLELIEDKGCIADLRPALSEQPDYYHKTDTHWNNLGAEKAYEVIMLSLGRQAKSYDSLEFKKEYIWQGDLTDLLYPAEKPISDFQYTSDFYDGLSQRYIITERKDKRKFDNRAYLDYITMDRDNKVLSAATANGNEQGSLLMLRDSFGRALIPYMIDSFGNAEFLISSGILDAYSNDLEGVDCLVLEIAERKLSQLTEGAQQFEAAETQVPEAEVKTDAHNTLYTANDFGYYELYGTLSDKMKGKVTVVLSDGNNRRAFRALKNRYTAENMPDGTVCDYYLSSRFESLKSGKYSVEVISNGVSSGNIGEIIIE